MGVNLILVFKKSVCDVILRNRSVYFAGIFIEQTVFVMDGLNLAEVDFFLDRGMYFVKNFDLNFFLEIEKRFIKQCSLIF